MISIFAFVNSSISFFKIRNSKKVQKTSSIKNEKKIRKKCGSFTKKVGSDKCIIITEK